jgi:uncharacterized NAD(P)/FAD-binding protein YdhS
MDTDITRTTHPLIQHLVAAGTLQPDPLGLGVRVSQTFEVLDADGQPVSGLYCVGALARGECWELTAINELRSATWGLSRRLRAAAGLAARDDDADSDGHGTGDAPAHENGGDMPTSRGMAPIARAGSAVRPSLR